MREDMDQKKTPYLNTFYAVRTNDCFTLPVLINPYFYQYGALIAALKIKDLKSGHLNETEKFQQNREYRTRYN